LAHELARGPATLFPDWQIAGLCGVLIRAARVSERCGASFNKLRKSPVNGLEGPSVQSRGATELRDRFAAPGELARIEVRASPFNLLSHSNREQSSV